VAKRFEVAINFGNVGAYRSFRVAGSHLAPVQIAQ
jgi:hypothetical protein